MTNFHLRDAGIEKDDEDEGPDGKRELLEEGHKDRRHVRRILRVQDVQMFCKTPRRRTLSVLETLGLWRASPTTTQQLYRFNSLKVLMLMLFLVFAEY